MIINLGIIGTPLSHSLSPLIHSYFIVKSKLSAGYCAFEVRKKEELADIISFFKANNFRGVNVTVPYKSEIIKYCDTLSEDAKHISAVNTLLFNDDGSISGFNTDIFGFSKMLEVNNVKLNNKNILLLGAGGASRAIFPLLNNEKPKNITIANRTIQNAEKLKELYLYDNCDIVSLYDLKGKEYDIVINSTSLGVDGTDFENYGFFANTLIDMIYKPKLTPFLKTYREAVQITGKTPTIINGLKMLTFQAEQSFNIWTNTQITADNKLESILESIL